MSIAVFEDYFYAFHLTRHKNIPLRTSLRRLLLPGFLTSLTTAFGFGALVTSDNMSVQNLGFWAAIGAMLECGLILFGLSALIRLFPSLNALPLKGTVWKPRWLSALGNVKPTRLGVLILTMPLLLIFFTYDKVNINYTPFDMFPKNHPLVQYRDYLKQNRDFEGEVSLVFDKNELTAEDSKIIAEVAKHPLVADAKDPYQIVEKLMPVNADPALRRLIRSEVKDTGGLKTYQAQQQSRALLYLRSIDIQSLDSLSLHTRKVCGDRCYLSGEIIAFKDYALSMLNTLYSSFVTSLVPVLLTMAFLCLASSGRILWPILLSTIWAPIMLLILVSLLQVKVNVVTCLAMALLTGLAGDNAIQFLFYDRKAKWSKGLEELKHSALLMFVVMTSITAVLLLSYFRSARILSGLILLGITLLLIGDLWILNHFTSKVESPDSDRRQ
jgi:predicted RND superfamily exporter protein